MCPVPVSTSEIGFLLEGFCINECTINWSWGNSELQYFLSQNLLLNSMIATVGISELFGIGHKVEIYLALSMLYILVIASTLKQTTVLH